jgi:hypothetical protein
VRRNLKRDLTQIAPKTQAKKVVRNFGWDGAGKVALQYRDSSTSDTTKAYWIAVFDEVIALAQSGWEPSA